MKHIAYPRFDYENPGFNFEEYYRFFAESPPIRQKVARIGGGVMSHAFRPQVSFAPGVEETVTEANYPFILAASHPTQLDPPVIGATIHSDPVLRKKFEGATTVWAKPSLMKIPVIGGLILGVGGLPVLREKDIRGGQRSAVSLSGHYLLKAAVNQMKTGRNQLIFPEGENSPSRFHINPTKGGISFLVRALNKEQVDFGILPVGIAYHHAPGRLLRAPYVFIGEPMLGPAAPEVRNDIHNAIQRSVVEAHRLAA